MINIDYFFENCFESTLLNFRHEKTIAHFSVQLYGDDQIITIQASTNQGGKIKPQPTKKKLV